MRTLIGLTVVMLGAVGFATARDCTFSKEFQIKRQQVLSGVLKDPVGEPLPGIKLELLSGKRVIQVVETDNQGKYGFGDIPPGKYRIHIRYGDDTFCAPKVRCQQDGCKIAPTATINPRKAVTVY